MRLLRKFVDRLNQWRTPLSLGEKGERLAAKFLRKKRYVIVGKGENLRLGEIDLVAVDRRTIVFVEVKTRRSRDKGHPADAVDEKKQQKISRIGEMYLKQHDLQDYQTRFDVVSIIWPESDGKPVIEHFESAFEAITGMWD